jgi:peptidoglycan/xylan/chitin deacetylase (PgdA/CDA1 family)
MRDASRVPILMYHALVRDSSGFEGQLKRVTHYWVTAREFERQMRALADLGYGAITLADLRAGRLPAGGRKPIIITFDDGFRSDLVLARPILDDLGWPSEHFVAWDWIGRPDMMTAADLRTLASSNAGVHSHTVTHRELDWLSAEESRFELEVSKERLETLLGQPVHYVALPSGRGGSRRVRAIARQAGYLGICTSVIGLNDVSGDAYRLRRLAVRRTLPLERLLTYVQGVGLVRHRLVRGAFAGFRHLIGPSRYDATRELLLRAPVREAREAASRVGA